jgi:hypothetical protein
MTELPGTDAPDTAPDQRIEVIGDATAEQVAALVAVLSAASGGPVEIAEPRRTSAWSAPARAMRRPLTPAQGAWQHSLRP